MTFFEIREFVKLLFATGTKSIFDSYYFSVRLQRNSRMKSTLVRKLEERIESILNDPQITEENSPWLDLPDGKNDSEQDLEYNNTQKTEEENNTQLDLPDDDDDKLNDSDRVMEYNITVFPSLSRLVFNVERPLTKMSQDQSLFSVEIYNPYLHHRLYHAYNTEARKENSKLTHPHPLVVPSIDPTLLGPNITFIALKGGKMIGYAMFSVVFISLLNGGQHVIELFQNKKESYVHDIFSKLQPINLFAIDAISVLNAFSGYNVSLILLYHGLHFISQYRYTHTITHIVASSVSVATKHNLVNHFGFDYYGRNVFANDDYCDTLDSLKRVNIQLFILEFAKFLIRYIKDPLIRVVDADVTHIAVITYQMAVLFNMRKSDILELLLVLNNNANTLSLDVDTETGAYCENNIKLFLRSLRADYDVQNWRRETVVYLSPDLSDPDKESKIGLDPPRYSIDGKLPIHYGYDQILVMYHHTILKMPYDEHVRGIMDKFNNLILSDLNAELTAEVKFSSMNLFQLRNINSLFTPDQLRSLGIEHSKVRETHMEEMRRDLKSICSEKAYAIEFIDTIIGAEKMTQVLATITDSYFNGRTKNFIQPTQDEITGKLIADDAKLDYMLDASNDQLVLKLNMISALLKMNNQGKYDKTIKVYENLNLLQLAEYFGMLTIIYHYRIQNWFDYSKS